MDRKKILDRLQKSIARPAVGSVITDPAPAVAPADPPVKGPAPAPVDLLGQIEADLDRLRPTDSDDDGLSELILSLPATAGRVHLVSRRDRPYVLVPNAPRTLVVGWGYELAKLAGTVRAGASGTFVLPRADVVTIDYPAGTAGDMLYVYASARPIAAPAGDAGAVALGSALVSPVGSFNGAGVYGFDGASTWFAINGSSGSVVNNAFAFSTALLVASMGYGWDGAGWDALRVASLVTNVPATAFVAGTPQAIVTPTAGKTVRLLGYALSLSVAGSILFKQGGVEFLRTPLLAPGIGQTSPDMLNGRLLPAVTNALQLDVTAAGNVSGYLLTCEE